MRKIEVVAHSKNWIKIFEAEKRLIVQSIPIGDLCVHHIGSTSVSGLAAKPIIDILLEVSNVEMLDQFNKQFESIGYECKGEFGISGRRYFQKGGDNRSHQIHAFSRGSADATRHLAFKDYLIAHKGIAEEYAALKYRAAEGCNNDINTYCDLKNDFVAYHEKLAVKWQTRIST